MRDIEKNLPIGEAEILEEMCQPSIYHELISAGNRISDAELKMLTQKMLRGSNVFPVIETEKVEGIRLWLSDESVRALIASVSVDYATMEGILKKVLQDNYDINYGAAKARAIRKHEIMYRALQKVMEIPSEKASERLEIWSKAWQEYIDDKPTMVTFNRSSNFTDWTKDTSKMTCYDCGYIFRRNELEPTYFCETCKEDFFRAQSVGGCTDVCKGCGESGRLVHLKTCPGCGAAYSDDA